MNCVSMKFLNFVSMWSINFVFINFLNFVSRNFYILLDHLLFDSAPNIGPLISRWELENPDTFVSAIFELVNFPTRYEWSKIRDTVQ